MSNAPQTDEIIHEGIALQELQAQQLLTSSVHHALQSLLPAAADHVESAACDLTQELVELATLVTAQQDLLKMVMQRSSSAPLSEEDIQAGSAQADSLRIQINESISGMIMGLQFQDRNSQLMHNAAQMLRQCEPPVGQQAVEISMVVRLGSIARARRMLASITIHEVREKLVTALEHYRVIPKKSKLPDDSSDHSVELF